ncbi:hypothetical protein [Weissella paramesenteroides]|uniref:hypothetical protein n=1 Tax=Weissella paramesenteroides TaxID=1249 RepID=UPI002073EE8C|nr:hypothetical protein [Weissella paramesenteroides]MCM6765242.1 hypothetical protein [Weissella paramesenteroides]MCM6766613.1 hypothetical protein [Weissella paramesenteroides]MCM6769036.1 hypothetical protein [Weissella paramesenteroides]MCM6771657.1 hypothetical protein [Weissella paramesenteroides]MCM6779250.1 hypothetical protein [Weissella paramesenteroides]
MMSDLDYWRLRLHEFIDTNDIDTISAIDKFNSLAGIGKVRFIAVVSDLVQPVLNQYNVDLRYFKLLLDKKMTSKKFTYQRVAIWAEYFHEEGVTPSIGNFDAIVPSYAKFK